MKSKIIAGLLLTGATVLSGAALTSTLLIIAQPAAATAKFAKDTGKSCGDCHTNPAGGGPLTDLGAKFKANGNKMPK